MSIKFGMHHKSEKKSVVIFHNVTLSARVTQLISRLQPCCNWVPPTVISSQSSTSAPYVLHIYILSLICISKAFWNMLNAKIHSGLLLPNTIWFNVQDISTNKEYKEYQNNIKIHNTHINEHYKCVRQSQQLFCKNFNAVYLNILITITCSIPEMLSKCRLVRISSSLVLIVRAFVLRQIRHHDVSCFSRRWDNRV